MISRTMETWSGWPTWAKWTSGISLAVVVSAASNAAGERDFVAGFINEIVAIVLHYGIWAGGIALGIWAGMRIGKRTRPWIGWVVGIGIGLFGAALVSGAAQDMPGVGWRMKFMADSSCYTDWDGRANPTVCD